MTDPPRNTAFEATSTPGNTHAAATQILLWAKRMKLRDLCQGPALGLGLPLLFYRYLVPLAPHDIKSQEMYILPRYIPWLCNSILHTGCRYTCPTPPMGHLHPSQTLHLAPSRRSQRADLSHASSSLVVDQCHPCFTPGWHRFLPSWQTKVPSK